MRRDFASIVIIIAAVLSVVGWGVWLLKRSVPAQETVFEQVVNATARVGQSDAGGSQAVRTDAGTREAAKRSAELGRPGSGVSAGLGAQASSLPRGSPSRVAWDDLITVTPEAGGELQELTLEQVHDTIRMTRQDLAVSAPLIEDLEMKLLEAGGEIVDGKPYFDHIEAYPEPARDFIRDLTQSLAGERHREAWRLDKLRRFESALQQSGHAEQ